MAVASGNGVKTAQNADQSEIVLSVRDVTVAIEDKLILDKLSLDIERGEILGFVGAS
ncbi:MAG: ABC transporter ATP-binding protein, partial [Mesorhizobium sp.]